MDKEVGRKSLLYGDCLGSLMVSCCIALILSNPAFCFFKRAKISSSVLLCLLDWLKSKSVASSPLVILEESSEDELSATDRLVTFPSMFILEKLVSVLRSAGTGSEKVNATVGEDAAEGTEGEEGVSVEASGAAASLS